MNNNIGRLGANSIHKMKSAKAENTPQVDNQNSAAPTTRKKPVSKSELNNIVKGNVDQPTNNTSTDNTNVLGTETNVNINNDSDKQETIVNTYYDHNGMPLGFEVIEDGRTGFTFQEFTNGVLSYYESDHPMFNPGSTLNDDLNNPDDWHLN